MLFEISEPTPRFFDGLVGSRYRELHDDRVAEPCKGSLDVGGLEGAKNKSCSVNLSAHCSPLQNHSYRPQPRLHQVRPCSDRRLRPPQPERMSTLRIQM